MMHHTLTADIAHHATRATDPVHDIALLRTMVDHGLKYLSLAQRELSRLEAEMDAFLTHYDATVGTVYQQWSLLHPHLTSHHHPQQHSTAPISYAGINREMKSIYRALVKHCHPDSGHYNAAAHTGIRQLNAVKSHSVNSLWNIQREWPQTLLPHAYGEQLVRLYDAIDQCIRKMLARIRSIRKSPAYQLKERARYARLNGVDLVEKIAADLKEKITSHRLMQTAA